ncbi:MAG: DUF6575 domain-containing protein [Chloroflexota bacterium]
MSVLPTDTFLGKLSIQTVYEYYDRPVLFVCHNATQTHYLVVLVDETDSSDIWLYVALSANRLHQIQVAQIDLHDAFKLAEDEIVYEVTIFETNYPTQIRVLPTVSLHQDQLPLVGEFLDQIISDNSQLASG